LALAISEVKCAILNKIAKNVSFGNTFLKNCGFKTLKKKNGAFLNWRQVGMFLKMHDFKGKIAILPNA
jgi:hypothetical protein